MIRCLAVDDEPLALDLLEDNIKRVPFLSLVGRCKNAIEALHFLETEQIDLIFLDIQMPGLTGTQFLKSLNTKPMVIFITAYKKYASDGFDLDVLDYLIKPVAFERFLKAATKALDYYNLTHKKEHKADYIFVNADYSLVKIPIADIQYIEGLKDYIKIYLSTSTRPVITRLSMKAMEEYLPGDAYVRVHKSFIVCIDKVISIRKSRILIGTSEIPISDHYKDLLYNLVGQKSLLNPNKE